MLQQRENIDQKGKKRSKDCEGLKGCRTGGEGWKGREGERVKGEEGKMTGQRSRIKGKEVRGLI